uniref:hypothetical protein n=1 Tax=Mycobacteroides abscessus TaxID=36809 RepID=UPI000C269F3B|nr:hypothetical protein [Mycobacteroides abscessus]
MSALRDSNQIVAASRNSILPLAGSKSMPVSVSAPALAANALASLRVRKPPLVRSVPSGVYHRTTYVVVPLVRTRF